MKKKMTQEEMLLKIFPEYQPTQQEENSTLLSHEEMYETIMANHTLIATLINLLVAKGITTPEELFNHLSQEINDPSTILPNILLSLELDDEEQA